MQLQEQLSYLNLQLFAIFLVTVHLPKESFVQKSIVICLGLGFELGLAYG